MFLMMGSFGPKRAHTSSPAITPPAPYVLADNPDSLLDKSDLVFVDAVGTGFSRIVGHATGKNFYGVDPDLAAFTQFIDRYLTVNQRWNSPKYLLGESYGTTRAAMLAYQLSESNIAGVPAEREQYRAERGDPDVLGPQLCALRTGHGFPHRKLPAELRSGGLVSQQDRAQTAQFARIS
ncbi:hypothetical protein [Paraburkholderia sp.]|uniref:hypothetical protein n=1 Tax=Paraburkholderia sp. TaxID=1926495 RepID=UPI003C70C157